MSRWKTCCRPSPSTSPRCCACPARAGSGPARMRTWWRWPAIMPSPTCSPSASHTSRMARSCAVVRSNSPRADTHTGVAMPSKPAHGEQRGWIIPIGGAEDKDTNPRILERFVELSGGDEADIVVIPTASRLKETGARYEQLFTQMGVARVEVMDFDTRRDCGEPGRIQRLSEASG